MFVKGTLGALVLVAANALATPLQFTSTQQSNTAVATNGATADVKSDSAPPSTLPLATSAVVATDNDFASAAAINGVGLLNTSAEADSTAGFASSDASAEFIGTFTGASRVHFEVQFDLLSNLANGDTALAGTNLFLTVASGGTTFYSDAFTSPNLIEFTLDLPASSQTQFSVLLESTASVMSGGSAFNQADVTFSASVVPEPSSAILLLLGSVAVFARGRARSKRSQL